MAYILVTLYILPAVGGNFLAYIFGLYILDWAGGKFSPYIFEDYILVGRQAEIWQFHWVILRFLRKKYYLEDGRRKNCSLYILLIYLEVSRWKNFLLYIGYIFSPPQAEKFELIYSAVEG